MKGTNHKRLHCVLMYLHETPIDDRDAKHMSGSLGPEGWGQKGVTARGYESWSASFLIGGTGDRTQDLPHAKQTLYH